MTSSGLLWGFLAAALLVAPAVARADEGVPFKTIPGEVSPELRTPPYQPAPPPLPPPRTPPLFEAPSPPPSSAPGLPPGPVTNYGTGGMQAPPGAPPNPPYAPGGLMH